MSWRTSQEAHRHYVLVDRPLFEEQEAYYRSNTNGRNPIDTTVSSHAISKYLHMIYSDDVHQSTVNAVRYF